MVVECAFCRLKNIWCILMCPIWDLDVKLILKIIYTSCLLHNFMLDHINILQMMMSSCMGTATMVTEKSFDMLQMKLKLCNKQLFNIYLLKCFFITSHVVVIHINMSCSYINIVKDKFDTKNFVYVLIYKFQSCDNFDPYAKRCFTVTTQNLCMHIHSIVPLIMESMQLEKHHKLRKKLCQKTFKLKCIHYQKNEF